VSPPFDLYLYSAIEYILPSIRASGTLDSFG
jgi:hypothetical protein